MFPFPNFFLLKGKNHLKSVNKSLNCHYFHLFQMRHFQKCFKNVIWWACNSRESVFWKSIYQYSWTVREWPEQEQQKAEEVGVFTRKTTSHKLWKMDVTRATEWINSLNRAERMQPTKSTNHGRYRVGLVRTGVGSVTTASIQLANLLPIEHNMSGVLLHRVG